MKKYLLVLTGAVIMASCTKKEETTTDSQATATVAEAPAAGAIERKSAENVDTLVNIIVQSLKDGNKDLYVSYCFTQEQEEALANLITDKKKKKYFQREFGFSLHEEVIYFNNIVNYIKKNNVDLNKVEKGIVDVFDYNKSNYEPIVLKEVVIPIIQEDFERDIVFVAAQIDGKWYFTSELSL
ncbi:MAG: hypothetical protein SFY32_02450 [Bacteroidota bacterium]|nr:hypothetical protein [Bacteroidota bacterium]